MAAASKTRVCIKNLPPQADEKDLKEFLVGTAKLKLEITDCKVLKNVKGKSRKVAFVGFRQEEHAKYVVDNFHRTFLRMSRLSVEPALAKKEEEKQTKVAQESSKATKDETKDTVKERQKKEFISLLGGSKKSKFWANDEEGLDAPPVPAAEEIQEDEVSKNSSDSSGSDSTSSESEEEEDEETKDSSVEETKEKSRPISDLDFLRSKQTSVDNLAEGDLPADSKQKEEDKKDTDEDSSDSDSSSESESENDEEMKPGADSKEHTKKEQVNEAMDEDNDEVEEAKKEEVSQSRLFVRNLPFETTEEELDEYFSTFGKLVECHIPVDDQKRNKGFAFVTFAAAIDALTAKSELDKVDFQGRLLHILPARPAPVASNASGQNLTWKQRQELARKEHETKNGEASKGWSASFVRGDAVVDNLADRLGLRKGDLLGVKDKLSSGDAAVRLALGETQIIEENREYFKNHGIDMEALVSAIGEGKGAKRSKTSILVKNLPYDTLVEELNKLFQIGEASVNIMLPPSRTIALVEYGHSSDAKKAFKKLAYRRFKHVPIYLEWAPVTARTTTESTESGKASSSTTNKTMETEEVKPLEEAQETEDTDGAIGVSTTIYVKNLNFETTEDTLQHVFEKNVGRIRSVKIPQKIAPARSGEEAQFLSMGYGFVELATHDLVKKAMSKLQGKLVDGHAWDISVSSKRKGTSAAQDTVKPSGKNPTKLVVRNVPFQATRQELLKLFGTFGQLRKVRLPKKFDGNHRGFAFVEFLTAKEALTAMNALSRTHLYGRHLVLEWATDDDKNIDRLREKAQRDTGPATQPKNKRIKFD